MVILSVINTDGEHEEIECCCHYHAREFARHCEVIKWWEIIGERGLVIDSADREAPPPRKRKHKARRHHG